MSWDALAPYLLCLLTSGEERNLRQDNLLFPLSRQTSTGISPSFPITSLTLILSFSHPICNPYFPVFLAILELLEYTLTSSTHSLNICWVDSPFWTTTLCSFCTCVALSALPGAGWAREGDDSFLGEAVFQAEFTGEIWGHQPEQRPQGWKESQGELSAGLDVWFRQYW